LNVSFNSANFDNKSLKTAHPFESADFHGLDRKDLKSKPFSFFLSCPVVFFPSRMIPSLDGDVVKMKLLTIRWLEWHTTTIYTYYQYNSIYPSMRNSHRPPPSRAIHFLNVIDRVVLYRLPFGLKPGMFFFLQ
jgi:hypothetical protein